MSNYGIYVALGAWLWAPVIVDWRLTRMWRRFKEEANATNTSIQRTLARNERTQRDVWELLDLQMRAGAVLKKMKDDTLDRDALCKEYDDIREKAITFIAQHGITCLEDELENGDHNWRS